MKQTVRPVRHTGKISIIQDSLSGWELLKLNYGFKNIYTMAENEFIDGLSGSMTEAQFHKVLKNVREGKR